MAFIIMKTSDSLLPLFVDEWAIVDGTDPNWMKAFEMNGFDSKIFKGKKKVDLQNIAVAMRLNTRKVGNKGNMVEKTIDDLKQDIDKGWSSFFSSKPKPAVVTAAVVSQSADPPFKTMFYHADMNMYECTGCKLSWPAVDVNEKGAVKSSAKCCGCNRTWSKWGVVTDDGKLYDFKGNFKTQLIAPPLQNVSVAASDEEENVPVPETQHNLVIYFKFVSFGAVWRLTIHAADPKQ